MYRFIIFIIFIYIFLIIYQNINIIKYLLFSSTYKSISINNDLFKTTINLIKKNNIDDTYTFIDFGSGNGSALLKFSKLKK